MIEKLLVEVVIGAFSRSKLQQSKRQSIHQRPGQSSVHEENVSAAKGQVHLVTKHEPVCQYNVFLHECQLDGGHGQSGALLCWPALSSIVETAWRGR